METYKKPKILKPIGKNWLIFAEDEVAITNAEMMGTSFFGFGSAFRGG